ncbi:DUF6197 family protein [Streptomyces smyrnaeus]|uniref:DUF6197 family protein n=1 Tax=Streptomyces smyrnaeus TaxID=1387713 RepID=UPI0036AFCA05
MKLFPAIYDKAADLIEEKGYVKGKYKSVDGCFCALGAIAEAMGAKWEEDSQEGAYVPTGSYEYLTYAEHAGNLLPEGIWGTCVPDFNDDPDVTKEDVTSFLRKVADELRNEYGTEYKVA